MRTFCFLARRLLILSLLAALVVLSRSVARAQPPYNYQTLNDPATGVAVNQGTVTNGISNGIIVGAYVDGGGIQHGFYYNMATLNYYNLDDPSAGSGSNFHTVAYGVSNGNIVGGYEDSNGYIHGFIYNIGTKSYTNLDDPNAQGGLTIACGISNNIIVGYYLDASDVYYGFIYNLTNRTYTTLAVPNARNSADFGSFATGVSNGNVVGGYYDNTFFQHGFTYNTVTQTYNTLDFPGGSLQTTANGIFNNSVVGAYTDDSDFNHGFLYNIATQTYTDLDDPAAGRGTFASAINGNNIVGGYFDANGYEFGFLATPLSTPVITLPPNQIVTAGQTARFAIVAGGTPAPGYQWQISTDGGATWSDENNGNGVNGATSPTLTISNATTAMSGNKFRVVVFSNVNSTTSSAVSLTVLPAGQTVIAAIAAGEDHSLFLKSDGSLWAMGYNNSGQLGDGTTTQKDIPEEIVTSGVTAIAAGSEFSLFLKSDGSLWAMGDNTYGELGDGTSGNGNARTTPEKIVASGVTAIAAGNDFSLFLKSDGSLWGMGENNLGELGDGTSGAGDIRSTPIQIVAGGVTAIATGAESGFSLFLESDGSLWGMGDDSYGQLALAGGSTPEEIVAGSVVAIAAGNYHCLFLKSDGSLWAMGHDSSGQLGDGQTSASESTPEEIVAGGITAIAAGGNHSLFLKSGGSLWAMGDNSFGGLGDGTTINSSTPVEIVASGVTTIAAGNNHSLFLENSGSLWAMGINSAGELGDSTTTIRSTPEQVYPTIIPSITIPPASAAVVAGTTARFTVAASGTPAPTYQWQVSMDGGVTWNNVSGSAYTGSTSATLTITAATAAELGYKYRAAVTNTVGTIDTAPVPLIVATSTAKLTWLQNNFTAAQLGQPSLVGDLAEPAGDGIPNLIKYAFNLNALSNGQASLPQSTVGNGHVTLTFPTPPADALCAVQASTDLINWSTSGVTVQTNGPQVTASYLIPAGGQAFLRITVSP